MNRNKEINELVRLSVKEFEKRGGENLEIVESLEDLHQHFAKSIAYEIKSNNEKKRPTVIILPFGPVSHYPLFVDIVNEERINLKNCHFFFMDENANNSGIEVPPDHPESFRGGLYRIFKDINQALMPPRDQIVFPLSGNIYELKETIKQLGGIQTCYGGIGIHGHVAFNEPERGVKHTDPRLVYLNDFTVTINAIRAGVGGDLINFPRKALTLGMNQILGAKRIRLYCRNDVPGLDWANTVLRLAVLGTPGDDFPVTYVNQHKDWKIITDRNTAKIPDNILPVNY